MAERVRFQSTKKQDARNAMAREVRNEIFTTTVVPLQEENKKLREQLVAHSDQTRRYNDVQSRVIFLESENLKLMRRIPFLEKQYEESVARADGLSGQNVGLRKKLGALQCDVAQLIREQGGVDLIPSSIRPGAASEGASSDAVNHPSHYGGDTVYEVIKVLRAWKLGFALGNAVKYIARAGKKDATKTIEDLKKAIFYINDEIKALS